MTDRGALLARLARLVAIDGGPSDLAGRLCSAGRLILGADGAAITVGNTMVNRTTLCATDDVMARLEDLQDVTGEGPSLDASRNGTYFTLLVDELPDPRWPEFARAAWQAVGRATMYSFPLHPIDDTFGVISVYLADERRLPEPVRTAQFLADAVGAALLGDPTAGTVGETGAWGLRDEVHQACGMVVVQLRVPPADALAILRAHAYATNTTLAVTARRVLNRELDLREDS